METIGQQNQRSAAGASENDGQRGIHDDRGIRQHGASEHRDEPVLIKTGNGLEGGGVNTVNIIFA